MALESHHPRRPRHTDILRRLPGNLQAKIEDRRSIGPRQTGGENVRVERSADEQRLGRNFLISFSSCLSFF